MDCAIKCILDSLNSNNLSQRASNHSRRPLVPLKYTEDICTDMSQKSCGYDTNYSLTL